MDHKLKSDIQVSEKRGSRKDGECSQLGGPQGKLRTGGNGRGKWFEFCPRPDMGIGQE